jgi:basic amino acid/polyamine antiporter, APA family
MSQLFARKPLADLQPPDGAQSLKRVLGAGDLVMLAIGAVIGAGIFGAIGTAAAGQVGPDGVVIRYGAVPICSPSSCLEAPARSPRSATRSWRR